MSTNYFPSTGGKPQFDPNASYQAVDTPVRKGKKPAFNPSASFEPAVNAAQPEPVKTTEFKPMTDWLAVGNSAQQRIQNELNDIDPYVIDLIYEKKKDLAGRIKSEQLAVNPRESLPMNPQVAKAEQMTKKDMYVSNDELHSFKENMKMSTGMQRDALNKKIEVLSKKDLPKANQIKADIYEVDAQTRSAKPEKVIKNTEKIKDGELEYDPRRGLLFKPMGFFESLIFGFGEKKKSFEDYGKLTSLSKEDKIKYLNEKINDYDPDKPMKIPTGFGGQAGAMIGGQPLKPIAGGVIAGALTTPAGGITAGSAIAGREMYKLTYGSLMPHNYASIKRENPEMPDAEVLDRAEALTDKQAVVDAAVGVATGAIGGVAGFRPGNVLQKSVGSALTQLGEKSAKAALEGLAGGAVGAAGQAWKNYLANRAGVVTDPTEGMADQLFGNAFMTVGIALGAKTASVLKPGTYRKLLHGLSKVPDEAINDNLKSMEDSGYITPDESAKFQADLKEQKDIDNSIGKDVPEPERIKIQDKIRKRKELEADLESLDKAFHPEIKEKIKAIDEDIVNVSKGSDRGELQKIVDKELKDGNVEGYMVDILKDATENDLKKYMKDIAERAQDSNSAETTLQTFGKNIVEKAVEMYPVDKVDDVVEQPKGISVIQPGEIRQPETITIKPKEDAISERSAAPVIVDETPGDSQPLGEGIPESRGIAIPQEGQVKEGIVASEEGKVGEPEMIGITHRQMDAISEELGLPTYEKSPERVAEWDQQAAKKLQEPDAVNNLFNKLRSGELPDPVETRMMVQYMADIKAKIDKNPYDRSLQDQFLRTKDIFNISGRLQGKSLVARKGAIGVEETLPDFLIRDREVNKAPLTDEQIEISKKEYEALKSARDAFEAKVAKDKEANVKAKAEKVIKEEAAKVKKQAGKDYASERNKILDDIKKKWNASKGKASSTFIPYADLLVEIAPDVFKLMKSYVEQGITELPDVVKAIHRNIKDSIEDITEKDVHDIIAGEYNKQKPTRNQLAQQLYDLKKEARLINELEQLQDGNIPEKKDKQIQINRKIEALKAQIKELRDEMGLNDKTDADKLAALKSRYKKQISELEKKIEEGDYGPDVKPEPITLDKEAQELKKKYLGLKRERQVRLAKAEYENRSSLQKAKAFGLRVFNTPRELMASFDFSAPLRQGIVATVSHPSISAKALPHMFKQAFSKERFTQWLSELKESEDYPIMEKAKLYIADPENLNISAKEEQFMGSLVDYVPALKKTIGVPVKASERAYVSYLNKMRVDIFRQGKDLFESQGRTIENSPELYEGLANYINNATGRGGLGPLNNAAPVLNTTFFSPRLIASRINMLNPLYYTKLPKEVRMMALKDMGKLILFGSTILGLARVAGADVEKDPRSSDFGKIKVGNTRWDVWGGFQQYIRLLSQVITGQTKSTQSGAVRELRGDAFPYKSRVDQVANFFRGKLAPVPATGVDLLAGRNMMGEEFDPANKAYELFVPMIIQDVREAWKDKGFTSLFSVGLPSAFGVGVSTYGASEPKSSGSSGSKKPSKSKQSKPSKTSK